MMSIVLIGEPSGAERGEPPDNLEQLSGVASKPLSDPPGEDTSNLPEYGPEAPRMNAPDKGTPIPDHYIIVFKPGTPGSADLARQMTAENHGRLKYTYEHALQGFAAIFSESKLDGLRRNPNVQSIEQDTVATIEDVQSPATWGLDRIDQRYLPLDNSYTDFNEGVGVHAYVIDTGIRPKHGEFAGRMFPGYDAVTSGGDASDCNGHGTHVAGTIGGNTYGVADKVRLYPVKVLNCNGSGVVSAVIAGVDWVRVHHVKPAVAAVTLATGSSSALDTAVGNLSNAGVTVVVPAGNDNFNACNYSPARVAAAITVGATTNTDSRATFSNYGSCLDLFAPGSSITSAWHTGDVATNTISGTCMAAAHVAGAAALVLSRTPAASPSSVRDELVKNATLGRVLSPGSGSPNLLLHSVQGTTPPPPASSVLVNPGFESDSTGWTQASSGGYDLIDTTKPRTGSYSAWLGGYNNATDSVRQTVTVPTNGTLTYWWYMTTSEAAATVYDRLFVRIYRASDGVLLSSSERVTNASTRATWSLDSVSLASYGGQVVWVSFYATTDATLPTDFWVDDTSLS